MYQKNVNTCTALNVYSKCGSWPGNGEYPPEGCEQSFKKSTIWNKGLYKTRPVKTSFMTDYWHRESLDEITISE